MSEPKKVSIVWSVLGLAVIAFWVSVCFGPPMFREWWLQLFDWLAVIFHVNN